MRALALLLLVSLLPACVSRPASRPIVAATALAGPSATTSAAARYGQPPRRLDCGTALDKSQELLKGVAAQRMAEGSHHAALAQLDGLPASSAEVALMRADALRKLQAPEAVLWYQALLGSCLAGQAEHGLGLMAAAAGRYAEAAQHLARAERALPGEADIRNDHGFVLLNLGQDAAASFALRTAAELAPDARQPVWNLALQALVRGDRASWLDWRQRLAMDNAQLRALDEDCRALLRIRQGRARATETACPVDPLR